MSKSDKVIPPGLRDLLQEPLEEGEDFAAMLDAHGGLDSKKLTPGDKVDVKVIHVAKDAVFCEVSPAQEGVLPLADVTGEDGTVTVASGDRLEVFVVSVKGGIELRRKLGKDAIDIDMLEQARDHAVPIEGTVTGVNKGGLEVAIGGARGFCPIGQADIVYVEEPASFVGKTFEFLVKEVREGGRNVVLSRRALLEAQRKVKAEQTLATLEVGARVRGRVSRLLDFGAFVDLGGIDGLIPLSELSWTNVDSVRDVLSEGDEVEVEVLRIEDDPKRAGQKRIGLSFKIAQPDPFVVHAADFKEGAELQGRVARVEKYGAFVELIPGVQGLVHISELSHSRVRHPSDVVQVGDTVSVRVTGVEPEERRISLSMKEARGAASGPAPAPGGRVTGIVNRIERYGVFVELSDGRQALLPAGETGTQRGTDLSREFPLGTELQLQIVDIDERGRIKVSKTARDAADERAMLDEYNREQPGGGSGFGTLGDLLKSKLKS
ncbi:MAG: S1 RNA-binding domain-containing protein [Myxococcota bacterium]